MKMCDIIKELRAVQRYGDKSEQTMAKRMLNNLYGEQHNKEEIERITLMQYLNTVYNTCKNERFSIKIKETWNGVPCLVDLGQFIVVKDGNLFANITLVKRDNETLAPQELYNLYIDKIERAMASNNQYIELTDIPYYDTDSIKEKQNGNND